VTTPQHDDPFGDGTGKVLQALAVISTVGESALRYLASVAQNRAAKSERQATAERVADKARVQADRATARAHTAQVRADRLVMDKAFDPDWLAKADIYVTATLWRTAAMYAMSGDRRATEARNRAQGRLRDLNPGLMDAYARHRAAGMNLAEAMKAAAQDVWQHQTRSGATSWARPHGSTAPWSGPPLAVGAVADPNGARTADDLETAMRAEVARLAEGVDLEVLDGLQRQWRSTGHIPAADAAKPFADAVRQRQAENQLAGPVTSTTAIRPADNHDHDRAQPAASISDDTLDLPIRSGLGGQEPGAPGPDRPSDTARAGRATGQHLAGLADQQQRAGAVDSGIPDIASTTVNEHQDAVAVSRLHRGDAEHDQAGAAQQQRLSRAFPPLGNLNPTFSAAPTTNPATIHRKGRPR
jgi:hypothetical protein